MTAIIAVMSSDFADSDFALQIAIANRQAILPTAIIAVMSSDFGNSSDYRCVMQNRCSRSDNRLTYSDNRLT